MKSLITFILLVVLALALAREDAVQMWRDLLAPKELEVAKAECPDRSQRCYKHT